MIEQEFAKTVAWLLRIQAILAALSGLGFAMIGGMGWALAALIGGAIGVFLTVLTALRVGLALGRDPKVMVRAFYRAMALKFVLAVIMFVIVAQWFAGYFLPVVTGYAATALAYWLAMRKIAKLPLSPSETAKRDVSKTTMPS
ncbi:MAG: ATP synthase subunit I, partial [Wenzhouxiangella sp.]|nr:ATP synthase subunit I [Wenzhouxiangella sp.]